MTIKEQRVNPNPRIESNFDINAFLVSIGSLEVNENNRAIYDMGDVRGRWAERRYQKLYGGRMTLEAKNQNTPGYDVLIDGKKCEIKTTSTICQKNSNTNMSYFQVGGLIGKFKKCHVFIILDLVNMREFRIPHDDFWNKDIFTLIEQGGDYSFRWMADYNPKKYYKTAENEDGTPKLRSEGMTKNTINILDYEILN
ncbi:hypothetical protein N9L94_06195 [Robiginitalea sp.]|jgi:hypothetical protein|nr:hypothetical protein [Robiginitalea sp.]|tara:strand:+ start:110 stop:700 length:591 start_codon:yes stop_codon:yes gene_type:complete